MWDARNTLHLDLGRGCDRVTTRRLFPGTSARISRSEERMKRALPTRTAVLDLIGGEDRALHAQEVADRLGVGPESYQGLLRLLDDLVFDGVLTARGQRFKLDKKRGGAAAKSRERREGVLT